MNPQVIPFRERLRYRFDTLMARGALGQILILGFVVLVVLSAIVALSLGLTYLLANEFGLTTFWSETARIFMLILVPDPVDHDVTPLYYLTGLLAIIAGLFIGGTLIGILSSAIEERVDRLRRGRSFVAETNHTVILGWSSKIFRIVDELTIANLARSDRCIVILTRGDSVELEQAIRERVPDLRGTRLVLRTGKPILTTDMALVNPAAARSVIILAAEDRRDPDSHAVKILLTLARLVRQRTSPLTAVVELVDRRNQELCAIAVGTAPVHVCSIVPDVVLPRLLVQSYRKRGLANVYQELFDFDGDEIYIHPVSAYPSLIGLSFGEALSRFPVSVLIGLVIDDEIMVNPRFETIIPPSAEVMVVAENAAATNVSDDPPPPPREEYLRPVVGTAETLAPERNLILGWNHFVGPVVTELDSYVPPGSLLTMASSYPGMEEGMADLMTKMVNHGMSYAVGSITDRRFLEELEVGRYDNVLILPTNPDATSAFEELDAETITCLVYVRDMARRKKWNVSLTTMMLLDESRQVADTGELGDFVVGDEILGRIVAQLSEEPRLDEVFRVLLTVEGSELYLRPADSYIACNVPVDGYTLTESARRRGEIYLGFLLADNRSLNVNPPKTFTTVFSPGDRLIVVAEN